MLTPVGNALEGLPLPREPPVLDQFLLVKVCPFQHQPQGSCRKFAVNDARFDLDRGWRIHAAVWHVCDPLASSRNFALSSQQAGAGSAEFRIPETLRLFADSHFKNRRV